MQLSWLPLSLTYASELQIVSSASGRSKTNLLKPLLEKMQPPLEKRRLMPLKHAAAQIGNAAAFTYCLQQRPCLLPLSQVSLSPPSGVGAGYENRAVRKCWPYS